MFETEALTRAYFSHLLHTVSARNALFVNKMHYSLLKLQKHMLLREMCSVVNALNLKKMSDKNPQLCPFIGLFCPFWVRGDIHTQVAMLNKYVMTFRGLAVVDLDTGTVAK